MSRKKLPDKNFKWTPELAYATGLIATDGCLSGDSRHIIMRSSDLELLKTFKKCLFLSNKIKRTTCNGWAKKPSYKIQFGNVQLYRWFIKIGITPRKTYTIGEIKIPDKYFLDFLRGHLDGDGSVWTYKDYYNTFKNPKYIYDRLWVRFISANKNHITWLRKNIFRLINIKGRIYERKPKRNDQKTSLWEIRFAKKESIKVLSRLYYSPNVPCLKRKRKIATKFI